MRLLLGLLFSILIINNSFSQEFKIHYYPSFHNYSMCSIICKSDSCVVYFEVYEGKDTSKIIISEKNVISKKLATDLFYLLDNEEKFNKKFLVLDRISVKGEYSNILYQS